MLTVIWVLGSMLLMLLIHLVLPLGYTRKGTVVIVVLSGLLASGGIASMTAIPLWQTLLLLLVLSFFAAYLMDSRMSKSLYMTKEKAVEDVDFEDIDSSYNLKKQTDKTLDIDLMDAELEISVSSAGVKQDEYIIPTDSMEEDITFLQERELENDHEEVIEDGELEVGYLSDIESLLDESIQEKVDSSEKEVESLDEDGWLDELAELTIMKDEVKETAKEPQVDDFELEELFADKEVAAASASDNQEIKSKKILELQK